MPQLVMMLTDEEKRVLNHRVDLIVSHSNDISIDLRDGLFKMVESFLQEAYKLGKVGD